MAGTACSCPRDGSRLCAWCTAALARAAQQPGEVRLLVGTVAPQTPETTDEPEARFLARILALAKQHSWLCYHTYRSDKSPPGFPDIVMVRPGETLWVECKTNTGKLTQEQMTWLSLLEHAGQECHVWRPKDWAQIEERLR